MKHWQIVTALGAASLLALVAPAQDTRHVTEPVVPPACTVLTASLHATDNALAETDEHKPDTVRIQKALDSCGSGRAVELKANGTDNAFLSGPLEMREGVTLHIDKGATLYASRNPRDFDTVPGTCGTMGATVKPCKPLIGVNVKNAAIMGDGVIDGRGDRIMVGRDITWWQQSREAGKQEKGMPVGTQGVKYSAPRLIVARHADGLVLYRIRLHNSPNFHVTVSDTDGFTAWGVHLLTPTVRGTDARNTDGIDPGNSQNITVTKSWIDNGDDNIAIKAGVHHMSVLDNHFYAGHGMSMGSEARDESDILVDTLTLDHTTSGIRIKSNVQRGGTVRNVTYRNVCMKDSPVPISITPYYTGQTADGIEETGMTGPLTPDYKGITIENVRSVTSGVVQVAGLNAQHVTDLKLNGVEITGVQPEQVKARNAAITVGPNGANFTFTGTGVTSSPSPTPAAHVSLDCNGKFMPYQD
ncbi:glycoside hydrolase family 28 protein [Terriglobus sp.]|uniref:glycoside hydrolase family 28 protein n=1 Tax=Terriglobus sp. TaxID=1889013 RepID=UPI003B008AC0